MASNDQITILVKKADGTTERISLAELKKRQAGASSVIAKEQISVTSVAQTPSVPSPKIIPVIPPVLKSAPAASTETLAMKNTEKEKFSIEKSLLTEEAPASPHAKSVVAATREDQVTKIISSLSF
jgi:hypothetical protein